MREGGGGRGVLHIRLGGQASLWRWYLIQGLNERAGGVRVVF